MIFLLNAACLFWFEYTYLQNIVNGRLRVLLTRHLFESNFVNHVDTCFFVEWVVEYSC